MPVTIAYLKMPPFKVPINIAAFDWSGARKPNGIALAVWMEGQSRPTLVPPPNGQHWQRTQALKWIATRQGRWLIGIDCAFALPAPVSQAWGCANGPELWQQVDAACNADADLHAAGAVAHPAIADFFWQAGRRPVGWVEHHRATEMACRADGLGAPETPLKLIGAKQVGWGGLAGMRLLHQLGPRLGSRLAIWPFQPIEQADIVLAEIYPRLFLRFAGHGNSKIRTSAHLDTVLAALGADPSGLPLATSVSDHDADALAAAAGLARLAARPDCWGPPDLPASTRGLEGWIIGVGGGLARLGVPG